MLTLAWLVVINTAVLTGQEPPAVIKPFPSLEACEVARAKQRVLLADDLRDQGAALACLRIVMSDA